MTLRRSAAQHGPDRAFLAWSADGRHPGRPRVSSRGARIGIDSLGPGYRQGAVQTGRAHEGDELACTAGVEPGRQAHGAGRTAVWVWNLDSAKQDFTLAAPESYVVDVGWAPDGRRVFGRTEVSDPLREASLSSGSGTPRPAARLVHAPGPDGQLAGGTGIPRAHFPQPDLNTPPDDVLVWDLTVPDK